MLKACLYLLLFIPWTLYCTSTAMLATWMDRSGRTCHRIARLLRRAALLAAGTGAAVAGTALLYLSAPE